MLTSLGLGFLLDVRWLFPLTAVFLLIAVVALGFRARRRRGFGAFVVGLGASAIVLVGKFRFESDWHGAGRKPGQQDALGTLGRRD